jgi:GDPmannose 4,6-dehydratase
MTKRALITGVAGQDGTYLSRLLVGKGYEVFGLTRACELAAAREICEPAGVRVLEGDLTDTASLEAAIDASRPDEIYNLAGRSSVGLSWTDPIPTGEVNALGVLRLVDAVRRLAPRARIFQASSAEIFGNPDRTPQDEQTPIAPITPYGASKAYAHFLMRNAREGWGLFACSGILYNHESPYRPLGFVTRKITDAVARIKYGRAETLRLGNLDAQRDWGFAGDYVEGMWLMLQADRPDDYVLATGVPHTVRDFCEVAFSHVGLDWRDHVEVAEEFLRPVDRQAPVGDASKARRQLGWEPRTGFEELVVMMVDADLARVAGELGSGEEG